MPAGPLMGRCRNQWLALLSIHSGTTASGGTITKASMTGRRTMENCRQQLPYSSETIRLLVEEARPTFVIRWRQPPDAGK
jgi:hypothetical protein